MTALAALSLLGVMFVLAALPSTSVAFVVTRTATTGLRSGAAAAAGIVTGDLIFVLLAVLGLTTLAETTGAFFAVFKYAGGAYLIWTGVQLLRARPTLHLAAPRAPSVGSTLATVWTSYLAGLVITLGDVKAILFYASLFPAFVTMDALMPAHVAAILVITALTVGGVKLAYAFLAQRIVARLQQPGLQRTARVTAGSVMIGTGTVLIAKA
jgi:threonine/homoserine/homoserine lactone efflux protein